MNEEDLIESFKKELFEFTDSPERCSDKAVSPESKITKQGYYKSVVRVADTPSPAIKRKFLKDKKHKLGKHRNKKPTPSKKGKKLLNREVQLNADDTLPGGRPSDAGMNLVRTQNTPRGLQNATPNTHQTPSSLFKPKSKMNFNEDEGGCDLSYGRFYYFRGKVYQYIISYNKLYLFIFIKNHFKDSKENDKTLIYVDLAKYLHTLKKPYQ